MYSTNALPVRVSQKSPKNPNIYFVILFGLFDFLLLFPLVTFPSGCFPLALLLLLLGVQFLEQALSILQCCLLPCLLGLPYVL